MRDCKVTLNANSAEVSQVNEYINEHGATRLVIALNDELKADSISYHTICFKPGAALKNPPNIKVTTDMLTAVNGTLTYPLPQALTGFGALDVQVQAHTADEKGELVSLIKSPVFRLNFEPSITGDEEIILGDASGFIAEIHKALKELNLTVDAADELCDRISEAFENGELNGEKGEPGDKGDKGEKGDKGDKGDSGENALINGFNAVTVTGGENLRVTQQDDVITLSVDSVPVYHTLPEEAQCGEICLYAPPNTISENESRKSIAFNWDGFCNAQNDSSAFDLTFYKNGTELGYINASYTFSDDMTYIENTLYIMFENEEWQICFINGKFESQYSYRILNGKKETLTEPPAYYTLPEFDSVVCTIESITDCIFYASLTPMVYLGEWQKIGTDAEYYTKQEIDGKEFLTAADLPEVPEPLTVTESNADYHITDNLFSLSDNASAQIPHAYFGNSEISVTAASASSYIIFARCANGYVIMNGAQKFYYIPSTATSSGSAKGIASLNISSLISAPVKFTVTDENSITIVGEIINYSFTAESFDTIIKNAGITDTFRKFVLGFARDVKADSSTGALATLGYRIDKKIKMFIPQEKAKLLSGKKISIIGDSISTFNGYMPSGYASHYPRETITDVSQTWWHLLCEETGATLLTNASMTGSYVTGDSTSKTDALAACSDKRIADLASGGSTPDIVICFIGINDFAQNVHRPLGNYTGEGAICDEGEITDFSNAYALMIKKVMSAYPGAKVYCCSLPEINAEGWDTTDNGSFPCSNNNGAALAAFNSRIRTLCYALGAEFIDVHACGINYWNLDRYTHDGLHPNADGARLIKNKIKAHLTADSQ